jgi:hypothetical protein
MASSLPSDSRRGTPTMSSPQMAQNALAMPPITLVPQRVVNNHF